MSAERIIAVDFGTSTSVMRVKRYLDGQPVGDRLVTAPVTFNMGYTMVPTLVQKLKATGESVFFGHEAEITHKNTVTFRDFKVDIENPDLSVRAQARALTSEFFGFLSKTYRAQSEGGHLGENDDKERTIVSYPVKWNEESKNFIIQTARDAGFPNVEGLDEAQAAIQAVTAQNADQLQSKGYFMPGVPCNILLIDMGAGTTDLVLCRYTPGSQLKTDILAVWPREEGALFGGKEMDELLKDYICASIPEDSIDIVRKKIGPDKYKAWKEAVVSPALMQGQGVDYFSALDDLLDLLDIEADYQVNRPSLESFAAAYLKNLPELVNGCLNAAGMAGDDIDLAILTGGHSQWYFVREILSGKLGQYGDMELGKIKADPNRIVSISLPQETVALGLAYLPLGVFSRSFDRLLADAMRGDAKAQTELGKCYYVGENVDQDYNQAVEWYRKAAEQGNAVAQCNLGYCYDNGQGVAKDHNQAVKWYRKAAEQELVTAQSNLGYCYANGQGVVKDYNQAVEWYRKAAEQGNAVAQNNLGVCYENGQGVAKDYNQAVKWYRKAAEQGLAIAQSNLGICYGNGQGVAKDYNQAVEWYRKAAEQGLARAQDNLGYCYESGQGVTRNYNQAVEWYRKAAEQGLARAQYNLGCCYGNGWGVAKDCKQAVEWYRKAAEQGNAAAQNNLGYCYESGQGVARDGKQAAKWYHKAAEQGLAIAQNNLGWSYRNGWGVARDYNQAVEWYRKAAEQGLASAQYNLGCCYENGWGVAKDCKQAVKWYSKAAGHGLDSAKKMLSH